MKRPWMRFVLLTCTVLGMAHLSFADEQVIHPPKDGAKIVWAHGDISAPNTNGGVNSLWVGHGGQKLRCAGLVAFKLPILQAGQHISEASFASVLRWDDGPADASNQLIVLGVREKVKFLNEDYLAKGTVIAEEFLKKGDVIEKGWLPIKTDEAANAKLVKAINQYYTDNNAGGKYLVVLIRTAKYKDKVEDSERRRCYDADLTVLNLEVSSDKP